MKMRAHVHSSFHGRASQLGGGRVDDSLRKIKEIGRREWIYWLGKA